MEYKIGQVAKMTGLSVSGIRFLEDEGLIIPTNGRKGTYRSYAVSDVSDLLDCRNYRECGLSLDKISQLVKSNDLNECHSIYDKRCKELEEEIRNKAKLLRFLRNRDNDISLIMKKDEFIEIGERPGILRVSLAGGNYVQEWPEFEGFEIPYADSSLLFDADLIRNQDTNIRSYWGIGICEQDVEGFQFVKEANVSYYSAHKAIHCIVEINSDLTLSKEELVRFREIMSGYTCTGCVISKRILSIKDGSKTHRYDHLWIDIE